MKSARKPKPMIRKIKQQISILENETFHLSPDSNDIIDSDLSKNEQTLRNMLNNCSDVVFRNVVVSPCSKMLLIYVDGLIDTKHLDEIVLKPLLYRELTHVSLAPEMLGELLRNQSLPLGETRIALVMKDIISHILRGDVAMLVEGEPSALIASIKGWSTRSIEEPNSEQVIRGPREGFVETIRVNTSMLRRKIRSPKLKMEALTIGDLSQTDVVVAYIEGFVPDVVLQEVRQRLNRIQIDAVLESGYIEEFIEDATFSPFPTVQYTERPDVVAANLLEGRVAIFVDGTPFVLVAPTTFWSLLQASEDYYERFLTGSFLRWIRFGLGFVALALPSLYVALISYQQEMVPTSFLITIAKAQEATPFPAVVEALLMEIMFEGLREAGVRLPKAVGSAVSIVGALVLGQAVVEAGVISAPMVIVVATTGIASFTIPRFNLGIGIRLLRFPLLILAGTFGFFGITVGLLLMLLHLTSLRSFGIPYFSPLAPLTRGSLRDVLIRAPWWGMKTRPQTVSHAQTERIQKGQKPGPQRGGA